MFISGLFHLVPLFIAFIVIGYLLHHIKCSMIISLACTLGYFSDLPLFTMGANLTRVTSTITIFQIIINIITLVVFIFITLKVYKTNNLYYLFSRYGSNILDKSVILFSFIGISIHQFRIFPKASYTAKYSLIIVLILLISMYIKSHKSYIQLLQNTFHNEDIDREKQRQYQYNQRQENRLLYSKYISQRQNIIINLENILQANNINFNNINLFKDIKNYQPISNNNVIPNSKYSIRYKNYITDDEYIPKAIKLTYLLSGVPINTINNIIYSGDTTGAYNLFKRMNILWMSKYHSHNYRSRINEVINDINSYGNELKYLHLINNPQDLINHIKIFEYNIFKLLKNIETTLIGETGEHLVRCNIKKYIQDYINKNCPGTTIKQFCNINHIYIDYDVNITDKTQNSNNNQLDILIVNTKGIFVFEVKTYGNKCLFLSNNGFIYDLNKDPMNPQNRSPKDPNESFKKYVLRNYKGFDIKYQTKKHINALATLFTYDTTISAKQIRDLIGRSYLVWVRKKNTISRHDYYAPQYLYPLYPSDCWYVAFQKPYEYNISIPQFYDIVHKIQISKKNGHRHGVKLPHQMFTSFGINNIQSFSKGLNDIQRLCKLVTPSYKKLHNISYKMNNLY